MKIHYSIKCFAAIVGSLALFATPGDAKPGKGNSGGKGQGQGGDPHSQRDKDKANKNKDKANKDKANKNKDKANKDKANKNKDKGPDHPGKAADKSDKHAQPARFARFKDNERNEILDYFGRYRTQGDGLPPGLAMNLRRGKPLPPGWQKKLVPGYRISDNEWASYAPVPSEWFPKLRMEPNTRLYHYGDRVVRFYEPRREVIDVIVLPSGR